MRFPASTNSHPTLFGLLLFCLGGNLGCLVDSVDSNADGFTEPLQTRTSSKDTNTTGNQSPETLVCSSVGGALCVPPPPEGWHGPVQTQAAEHPSGLLDCATLARNASAIDYARPGPDPSKNIYVGGVWAPAPACDGCVAALNKGSCTPLMLTSRVWKRDGNNFTCFQQDPKSKPVTLTGQCQGIDSSFLVDGTAVGAVIPTPKREKAECSLGEEGIESIGPPTFKGYSRVCSNDPLDATCDANRVCFAPVPSIGSPFEPYVCVHRKGRHKCPVAAYNQRRTFAYGEFRDSRTCGECKLEHQEGVLSCKYKLELSVNDRALNCARPQAIEGDDLCIRKEIVVAAERDGSFYSVRGTVSPVHYSGNCQISGWGAAGGVSLQGEVTYCCDRIEG